MELSVTLSSQLLRFLGRNEIPMPSLTRNSLLPLLFQQNFLPLSPLDISIFSKERMNDRKGRDREGEKKYKKRERGKKIFPTRELDSDSCNYFIKHSAPYNHNRIISLPHA